MDKDTERQLTSWLKEAALSGRGWQRLATLLGFANGLLIIGQAWLMASLLHGLIINNQPLSDFTQSMILLALLFPARSLCLYGKEVAGFEAGARVRQVLRRELLDKLGRLGPAYIQQQPSGSWSAMLLEQVEKLQEFYAKYLPQMMLVGLIPAAILIVVFPINWAAGLIFTVTAPLTVLFMVVVGMGAADANKRNFLALARLSGHFLDRLRGLRTVRQFDRVDAEVSRMEMASDQFRRRTMEVLRMAFLSSAVLEFFASISIAVVAVYFGFSYLGELNFGHYGAGVTLLTGLLVLILAPEFFQPFRDLGAYYHAKAQALGAAESLIRFMDTPELTQSSDAKLDNSGKIALEARDLVVTTAQGKALTAPISFRAEPGELLTVGGVTGSGKTSLMQALMGFLPYQGSLTVNGIELSQLPRGAWLQHLTWLGQNPVLLHGTVAENLRLAAPDASDEQLWSVLEQAHAAEFVRRLPGQLSYQVNDRAGGLSVGQAQRLALARALLKPSPLLLLDEPSASLDRDSEQLVNQALQQARQGRTTVLISHRPEQLAQGDQQLVMGGLNG
ncbi:heme ABC transporter permease/ATP-binding protein CydD [Ferrimonas balearica]|uniref:heme ABC transporter permease/ATP-binding protein CydD n=1 Tax=Ferrimonas balearica TaxID=44012 RepID=UPI001C95A9A8|nr:cysteine/glutathione ABC transporter permease/ATP-binding protein CydD [Ferrimonas balearica]MBY5981011.1 cysteine/glutathione ABC transporter permease/ATP-binding protein CydD [Ferrimonas balearica]